MTADVIVVGAGIVGCATAAELASRGARVTLLDRGEVSGGTTGLGEGDVLCADKDAGPELALAVAGRALYAELEARLGPVAGIRRKGALVVHPVATGERAAAVPRSTGAPTGGPGAPPLSGAATWAGEPARLARLRAAGVEASLLTPDEVRAREPALTGAIHGALWVPGDLQCDPRAIARALAAEAVAAGATVRTGAEVVAIEGSARLAVTLAGGERLGAGAVVLAAGPWSAPLAATAGLRLPVQPRKGQLVQLRATVRDPQLIRAKVVDGSYLADVASPDAGRRLSTVVETTADGDVIVGSSRERAGFDPAVDPAVTAALRERAARLVPAVAHLRVARTWVGFRPWLPDGLPAIGPSTRVPGLWVATGHEGAGVGLGPISGRLLARALGGERPSLSLAPFDPDRFA